MHDGGLNIKWWKFSSRIFNTQKKAKIIIIKINTNYQTLLNTVRACKVFGYEAR